LCAGIACCLFAEPDNLQLAFWKAARGKSSSAEVVRISKKCKKIEWEILSAKYAKMEIAFTTQSYTHYS